MASSSASGTPAPPAPQSSIIPGMVKKRKAFPFDTEPRTVITDHSVALALFDKLIAEGLTPEATFLTLMQRYNISPQALDNVGAKKLKHSFSRVKYTTIAPLFGLDPTDSSLSDIEQFQMQRAWLPLHIVHDICRDVEIADVQYGQMRFHNNEEARSRYIATLFNRIIYLFQRKVTNLPEEILEAEMTDRGRIEHQFLVYGAVVVLFIEVKKELLTGKAKLDQVAQVLAEADACDYRNSSFGLWVPILGILCDGRDFEFFVYDSSTRKFALSVQVQGLQQYPQRDLEFLRSIKRVAEYMYDFFLAGYVNGLRAFLSKSTTVATRTATKRLSTDRWISALKTAEDALEQARCATRMASASGGCDPAAAEVMAVEALRLLNRSVEEAPEKPKEIPSYMDSWNDKEMQMIE